MTETAAAISNVNPEDPTFLSSLTTSGFVEVSPTAGDPRFVSAIDVRTKTFWNKEQQRLLAFAHFGTAVEGPPQIVHGGAVFTVVDTCLALLVARTLECLAFTANISINYRAPVPLQHWVVVDTHVDRIEKEKKVFLAFKSYLKGTDGQAKTVADGTSLFIAKLGSKPSL